MTDPIADAPKVSPLRVLGLDLSLTATGVAWPDGELSTLTPTALPKNATHADIEGRLVELRGAITSIVFTAKPDVVALEGFSFASKGSSTDQIYGLGWTVRLLLADLAIAYAVVPPSSVKKYATGSGTAKKPDMRMALYKRAGLDVADDNQVDAWWLRAMALDFYDAAVVAVPQSHNDALAKIDWPVLERSAA